LYRRPIRKRGETIQNAVDRGSIVAQQIQRSAEKILELEKMLKAEQKKNREENKKQVYSDKICTNCGETKNYQSFKTIDIATNVGICLACANHERTRTRKMSKTVEATTKAVDLMAETLKDINRVFSRHKLPLEAQVVGGSLLGITDIIKEIQVGVKCMMAAPAETLINTNNVSDAINQKIAWPIILYTLAVCGGNQCVTAQVLGMSRNTLRDRLYDINANCPRLIDEYRCQEVWPKELNKPGQSLKLLTYLEVDPNLEVGYEEENVGGITVIDSGIND
jgi:hypothetical protein